MAKKPFDPFADHDTLEFMPELSEAETQIKKEAPRPRAAKPLRLEFEELDGEGGDTRGAERIGGEALGSDDFLVGIKRRDYEAAAERARRSLAGAPVAPAEEDRVIAGAKTPIYLVIVALVAFVAALAGGSLWLFHRRLQQANQAQPIGPEE